MSKATDEARIKALNEAKNVADEFAKEEEALAENYGEQGRGREGEDAFTRAQAAKGVAERIAILLEPVPAEAPAE